jgi:hypothetical protein
MADEPNKHIDQILRDYARARREGVHIPLHPSTRKRLHAEVARRYGKFGPTPFLGWIRAFWPQIAFGAGLCTILLISVVSLRHRKEPAKNVAESVPQKVEPQVAAPPPPAEVQDKLREEESLTRKVETPVRQTSRSAEKEVDLRKQQPAPSAPRQLGMTAPAAPDSAPAPQFDLSKGQHEQTSKKLTSAPGPNHNAVVSVAGTARSDVAPELKTASSADGGRLLASSGVRTPLIDSTGSAVKTANLDELTNLGAAMRVQFVGLPDRYKRDVNATVLRSFQVEQAGQALSFLDRDGSIYSGQLSVAPDAQAAAAIDTPQNAASYYFRAQGTNLTLGKPVTIEGQYIERTNVGSSPERSFSFSTNTPVQTPTSAGTPLTRAKRAIVGRATVARTNEFPVTAVSVEP